MSGDFDEKAVFLAALALEGEQREEYLRQACPTESVRQRIRALLEHHRQASLPTPQAPQSPPDASPRAATTIEASRPHPQQIDEFRIERQLAEGGMGVVYLARDTVLNRSVALKVLASHLTGSESALQRFITEARSAAALNHPGIVPVYKLGFDGSNHYIVSELVDGPTLAAVLGDERERRRHASDTADIRAWQRRSAQHILAIADALEASHRAGIIHRDVKPSNILIDQTHGARLTDFGIARHLGEQGDARVTARIGTCHYMSPEQASLVAARVDQRSDVFSLGVVMYEALSLERPFEGKDVDQVLRAVIGVQPRHLRKVDRSIPKDLETICHKAIEKQPEQRYQSAGHMAADVRCWLENRPILARPPGTWRSTWRWVRAHRAAALVGLIVLLAATIAGLLRVQQVRERDRWRAERVRISIAADRPGASVYARKVDPETLEHGPVEFIGVAPIAEHWMLPGQYRFEVIAPDGAFAEIDEYFDEAGTAGDLKVAIVVPADLQTDMIHVPANDYPIGPDNSNDPATRRMMAMPGFYIDAHEVSNAQYAAYLAATGAAPPPHWDKLKDDRSMDNRPVVWLTWPEMQAYARWAGKRLPTVFEWECAARGVEGHEYPWGDDLAGVQWPWAPTDADRDDLRRVTLESLYRVYRDLSHDVTADPSLRTPKGLMQMLGNAQEATSTLLERNRVILVKGGSWMDGLSTLNLRLTVGRPLYNAAASPRYVASITMGFRCARSQAPIAASIIKGSTP